MKQKKVFKEKLLMEKSIELKEIINAIEDRNGEDIQVIDLDGLSIIADCFVITSADNERQVNAITERIDEKLSEKGFEPLRIEGKNNGRWVLMDYGDVVVHIFHEKDRAFYNLERLWNDSKNIEHI